MIKKLLFLISFSFLFFTTSFEAQAADCGNTPNPIENETSFTVNVSDCDPDGSWFVRIVDEEGSFVNGVMFQVGTPTTGSGQAIVPNQLNQALIS